MNVVSKKPVGGTFKPSSKNLRSGRVNIIQHNSINSKYPPSTFTPLILFSMVCVLVKDSNCKCEFPICKEIQRPAPFRICENSFIHNGLFQIWFPSRTFFFFFLAHWSTNDCWKLLQKLSKEDINNLTCSRIIHLRDPPIFFSLLTLPTVKCLRNFCAAFII